MVDWVWKERAVLLVSQARDGGAVVDWVEEEERRQPDSSADSLAPLARK